MKITKEGFAVLENDTHIGKWVEEHGRLDFDQNSLPFILKYIPNDAVVIDAGANIGCYSYAFKDKALLVICFEPNEEIFKCLDYNLRPFHNVIVYNEALGSKFGFVKTVTENDNVGMTYCKDAENGIQIKTIDSMKLNKCDFIKIDVEGYELEVLKGAIETITKYKPKLYIEINTHTLKRKELTPLDIFDFLYKHNYKFKNIYPHGNMEGDQYDIICW